MTLKVGALCAGYLGLELGLREVIPDVELAWMSEIDPGACKIAAHRFPGVPNVGDMTTADWTRVEPVDVITGGTPCQDLSHAGKRGGMTEGTRSNLWVAMREAVAALSPRYVVWENVRGALSAPADSEVERGEGLLGVGRPGPYLRAAGRVVGDLAGLGYDASWCGLPASGVGAPHGRYRIFVVAAGTGVGRPPGRSDLRGREPDTGGGGDPSSADAPNLGHERVGQSRRRWAGPEDGSRGSAVPLTLLPTPTGRDDKGANQRGDDSCLHGALIPTPLSSDAGPRGGTTGFGLRDWSRAQALLPTPTCDPDTGNGHARNLSAEARLLPTPRSQNGEPRNQNIWERPANEPQNLENALAHALTEWGQYAAAIHRWEQILGRQAPPPTQLSNRGTPQLSARFSEFLMGLPDGWVTDVPGITRNEALRALGNGVVPQQAAAALRYLLSVQEVPA